MVHVCESVCTVCGKCMNSACTDPVCAEKCMGHVYEFRSTTAELLANNEYQTGFVMGASNAGGLCQKNILTLHSGGTYTLVKSIESTKNSPMAISVRLTFEGIFTKNGETVILDYPSFGIRESDWGIMASVLASEQGTVTSVENPDILRFFPSEYFLSSVVAGAEQVISLNEEEKSALWQEVDPAYYGNSSAYKADNIEVLSDTILKGKVIGYLGSSVTYGACAGGESFAEYIAKRLQTQYVKEAVSGTTLVDNGDNSYISRLLKMDNSRKYDLFVCQLSTNDANSDAPLGEILSSDSKEFDKTTVAGAIEFIINYVRETFGCPVVFYTNAYYENARYAEMVDILLAAKQKYGIGVIDLYGDKEFNDISESERQLYMVDNVHPSKAGYLLWWTPVMEQYLLEYYAENI